MIHPFRIPDILLVHGLQRWAVRFDQPEAATRSRSPLWLAISHHLLHVGPGACTFVMPKSGDGLPAGLIQARPGRKRPEWNIVTLAPLADDEGEGLEVWENLVNYASHVAALSGAVRVFVKAPRGGCAESALAKCGFSGYAYERIWEATNPSLPQAADGSSARLRQLADDWALHQLYLQATPSDVQAAEGQLFLRPDGKFDLGLGPGYREYVWHSRERLGAHMAIAAGMGGYVFRLLADPDQPDAGPGLLAWTLGQLPGGMSRPIYCVTRHYTRGCAPWLSDHGFVPVGDQTLMVKHLAVRIKDAMRRMEPAMERRVKTIATRTYEEYTPK